MVNIGANILLYLCLLMVLC